VLLLAAVSLVDAGAVSWAPLRFPRWAPVIAALGAAALLVPVLVGDVASVTYRLGTEDVWAARWSSAVAWYETASTLDPWQPSGPKALTIAADMVGDPDQAIAAAREATRLNPADGPSWTNLAVLCSETGDRDCALAASEQAARWSPITYREVINAALVEAHFGNTVQADALYRDSLVSYPYTALSVRWPRPVSVDAANAQATTPLTQLAVVLALAAEGERVVAPLGSDPAVVAVAAALRNERTAAAAALRDAEQREPYEPLTWQVAAVLDTHWGEDPQQALAVAEFLQNSPLTHAAVGPTAVSYEIASLHIIPRDELVRGAQRLMPTPPWPWALERLLPPSG
jgi:tetratricopeptide (TPR) repeat protein